MCGPKHQGYFHAVPVASHALSVASSPVAEVSIAIAPVDKNDAASGNTPLSRAYIDKTVVSLTTPLSAGGQIFQKWQRDGSDFSTAQTVTITMDADHALTAIYVTPTNTGPAHVSLSFEGQLRDRV